MNNNFEGGFRHAGKYWSVFPPLKRHDHPMDIIGAISIHYFCGDKNDSQCAGPDRALVTR